MNKCATVIDVRVREHQFISASRIGEIESNFQSTFDGSVTCNLNERGKAIFHRFNYSPCQNERQYE